MVIDTRAELCRSDSPTPETDGDRTDRSTWTLFAVRTRIAMRMNQLELSHPLRKRVVEIISRVTDIPRLTAFARKLDARRKRRS